MIQPPHGIMRGAPAALQAPRPTYEPRTRHHTERSPRRLHQEWNGGPHGMTHLAFYCKTCGAGFSAEGGGATALRAHMMREHPWIFDGGTPR